jgi:hypothetical protein
LLLQVLPHHLAMKGQSVVSSHRLSMGRGQKNAPLSKTSQLVGHGFRLSQATEIDMGLFAKLCLLIALFTLPVLAYSNHGERFEMRRERTEFRRELREANRERIREGYRLRSEMRQEIRRARESFRWATRDQARYAMREAAREMRQSIRDARNYWRE